MSNMSYCRFTNTLADLEDCNANMDNDLSGTEFRSRARLIALCRDIADSFEDDCFVEKCSDCGHSKTSCICDDED